jgi:hypothetical protein
MSADWLTTTLPVSATEAYNRFVEVDRLPHWLPIVRSARVTRRAADGMASRASFMAELDRGSVGYTLAYRYDHDRRLVAWATRRGAALRIAGCARFTELGPRACMMEYRLSVHRGSLPSWSDRFYDNHATSAVLSHFRDYLANRLH